jgi:hypothetical protein
VPFDAVAAADSDAAAGVVSCFAASIGDVVVVVVVVGIPGYGRCCCCCYCRERNGRNRSTLLRVIATAIAAFAVSAAFAAADVLVCVVCVGMRADVRGASASVCCADVLWPHRHVASLRHRLLSA